MDKFILLSFFIMMISLSFQQETLRKFEYCTKILEERIQSDKEYIDSLTLLVNNITQFSQNQSPEEFGLFILNCIKNHKEEELKKATETLLANKTLITSPEYKKILGLEEVEAIFKKNDKIEVNKKVEEAHELIQTVRMEKNYYQTEQMGLFGVSFVKMSPFIKNVIGLGLLGLFAGVLLWLYSKLQKKEVKKKHKKSQ